MSGIQPVPQYQPQPYRQLPDFCPAGATAGSLPGGNYPGLSLVRTNHILHLILTLVTCIALGGWGWVWLAMVLLNASNNKGNIERYNQWVAQQRGVPWPPPAPVSN